jgi:hypothetical protein
MAPPQVMAASRAPRRARTVPVVRSRWRCAPLAHPFGQHGDHLIELAAVELGVLRGAPDQREDVLLRQLLAGGHRHHLLGQDVERCVAQAEGVEPPARDRPHQRRQLDQLVARGREQPPFRGGAQ